MSIPSFIKPMEPLLGSEPFDSQQHLFQLKWDGVRCLAYLDKSPVLINRRGNHRTLIYPELVAALQSLASYQLVLDGEIVALDQAGKPSFRRILSRDLVASPTKAASLVHKVPVQYMVFDLLYLKGKSLCHLPLEARQQQLQQDLIRSVESFYHIGKALFSAVEEAALEGIIAKEISSPYLPGQKTAHWYKIKRWQQQQAVLCGLLVQGKHLRSLVLGAYNSAGQLIYIGNASSGLTEKDRYLLMEHASSHRQEKAPLLNPPSKLAGELIWLEPAIALSVKYLEWTSDYKLRSPSIVSFLAHRPSVTCCRLDLP